MSIQEAVHQAAAVAVNCVIYIGTPIATFGMYLFAMTDTSLVGSLVGSMGATGLLAWFLYYHVKVERPRLDRRQDERDAKADQRQDEREKAMRTHYEGIIDRIEANDKEKNDKLCLSLDGVSQALKEQSSHLNSMTQGCGIRDELTELQQRQGNDSQQ